ncbi:hypothetical protein MERGE_001177 [Pneumocystis wakefieldiae]|uniref:Uncharacterized protein n=1 Tax=Pneumocystis wakefieldiae TaxID=38082 RepID=A0A899FYB6_9ASCO|nr:hypothetical protein MERGE_001177 [Pneumocystis wakefieldiae]
MSDILEEGDYKEFKMDDEIKLRGLKTMSNGIDWTILATEIPLETEEIFQKVERMEQILYILKNGSIKENIDNVEQEIVRIVERLCEVMRPINEMRQFDASGELERVSKDIQRAYHKLVNICLQCIDILLFMFTFLMENPKINNKIIQALATYQINTDPWTSMKNYSLSSKILGDVMKRMALGEILDYILMNDIRPYFSTQQNKLSCRKNMQLKTKKLIRRPYENIRGLSGAFGAELWKTERIECTSILEWILFKDTAVKNIYLIISFLVILLEDADPHFKLKSSRCLDHLLPKCDSALMKKTGMGDLFWELVTQCLSYHPPSIDISISIPLLRTSLNNLIALAFLMQPDLKDQRVKLYDEIVYNGIFNGMFYSGEQSDMVVLLMEYTEKLVNIMGIYAVKHIKMLISLVSSVLEKSFQINHPQCFLEAAKALKTIIHVCWPRIEHHHATILQGICFCWLNIQSQKGEIIDETKNQLHFCVKSLKKIMGNKLDNDIKTLMDTDPNLALFFKDI